MASPARLPHGVGDWTETDQAIIETLLLADNSPPRPGSVEQTTAAPGSVDEVPSSTAMVGPPPLQYPFQMQPAAGPVAYWIATPLPQQHPQLYYTEYPFPHAAGVTTTNTTTTSSNTGTSFLPEEQFDQLSEEERKAKHRAVQRRFVQRKKEELARVRHQVAQLEKKLKYLQLTTEQHTLEQQNGELQAKIVEPVRVPTIEQIQWLLEQECRLAQQGFVPFSDDAFSDLLKETMQSVAKTLIQNTTKLQSSTKIHVSGWTGRRLLERDEATDSKGNATMRLVISKHFAGVDVDDMVNRTWRTLNNPAGYGRMFSALMPVKIVILQHVNEDSIVLFKTMYNPSTGAIQHAVDLLCRIRACDEVLIISRGLPMTSVITSLQDPSGWCHSLNVLSFGKPRDAPHGTCFRYNVYIGDTLEANLRYWFIEIIFMMIRFETILVAPLFMLGRR